MPEFEKRQNKRILVTVPNRYWMHTTVVRCLLLLMQDRRYQIRIEFPNDRPYENNLNHIVNDFMKNDFDFWFSMDVDNPPYNNPLDLVAWDKDIIGLPTPIWYYEGDKKGESPIYWSAFDYHKDLDAYKEHRPREGLQPVDAIGTGCFLIARRVFENEKMRQGPFLRQWLPDGTVFKGNDHSFCERARENGFKIYCHYDYPCDHYANLSLTKVMASFKNMYEKDNDING